MKFTTATAALAKAASDLSRVAARANTTTVPILQNIKIATTSFGTVEMTATNLQITLTAIVAANIEEPGEATVDAAILNKYLGASNSELVGVASAENAQVTVKSGRSHVSLNSLPAHEFPSNDDRTPTSTFSISSLMFGSSLRGTAFAASDDDTRGIVLQSVRFRIDENGVASIAATDGYVLALHPVQFSGASKAPAGDYLIPGVAATEIARLIDKLEKGSIIELGLLPAMNGKSSHLTVRTEDRLLALRLTEGNYPDINRIIPASFDRCAIVKTSDFIGALKRSSLLGVDRSNVARVVLTIGAGSIAFDATNDRTGNAHEEIDATVAGEADLQITFNANILIEAAKHIETDTMRIDLLSALSPLVMRPVEDESASENLYILMPMRA
jgi:DNA polymerase-3 subunit beta